MLFGVASKTHRTLQILESHGAAPDHPVSIDCPASSYFEVFHLSGTDMNLTDWLDESLMSLQRQSLRRQLTVRMSSSTDTIVCDGRRYINFAANDYLGLANDERVRHAAQDAIEHYGWGSGASPLVTGRTALHAALESQLAHFEHAEAALLFPTGYAANVAVITSLVGPEDLIFSDAKNHASLIDGCRLSLRGP